MKAIDLLFYLNYKHRSNPELGYMMLALLMLSMAIGFLGLLGGFGFDVVEPLTKTYRLGFNDNVRSIFSRRAGPAVLFVFPIALFFCLAYAKIQAVEVIQRYDSFEMMLPTWLVAGYSIGLILSTFVIAVISRNSWPILGFLGQLAIIAIFHLIVVDEVLRRFKTVDRNP